MVWILICWHPWPAKSCCLFFYDTRWLLWTKHRSNHQISVVISSKQVCVRVHFVKFWVIVHFQVLLFMFHKLVVWLHIQKGIRIIVFSRKNLFGSTRTKQKDDSTWQFQNVVNCVCVQICSSSASSEKAFCFVVRSFYPTWLCLRTYCFATISIFTITSKILIFWQHTFHSPVFELFRHKRPCYHFKTGRYVNFGAVHNHLQRKDCTNLNFGRMYRFVRPVKNMYAATVFCCP